MTRGEMLKQLEEVVVGSRYRRLLKMSDERLYKECVECGIIDTRSESEKEYDRIRKEIHITKGTIRDLADDKCSDIMGAVSGRYVKDFPDCSERIHELNVRLSNLRKEMEKNEHYKMLNCCGTVAWDA